MHVWAAMLLVIAGGAALAVQNAVMAAVAERGVGFSGTLIINSTIGLIVLVGMETMRSGPASTADRVS